MKSFVIPANPKIYRAKEAFDTLGTIHWTQGKNKSVNVGDIIYIYETKPTAGIILKTEVVDRDVTKYSIDDSQFWCIEPTLNPAGPWFTLKKINNIDPICSFLELKNHGLKGYIQSLRQLDDALAAKIENN